MILPGEANRGRGADPALLRAVARGYRWFSELASGTATNTLEIAKRDGVGDSYVRRLIPLALLAPTVIEAIRNGRHPAELTTEALTRRLDLPIDWREQERLLAQAL